MNESDTRLHKIDPALKAAGWNSVDDSKITTEYVFTRIDNRDGSFFV